MSENNSSHPAHPLAANHCILPASSEEEKEGKEDQEDSTSKSQEDDSSLHESLSDLDDELMGPLNDKDNLKNEEYMKDDESLEKEYMMEDEYLGGKIFLQRETSMDEMTHIEEQEFQKHLEESEYP